MVAIPFLESIHLTRTWPLWGIPIAAALLFLFLAIQIINLPLLPDERRRMRTLKAVLFCSRLAIIALLLVALCEPYREQTIETQGNPRVTFLVDNSASVRLMDTAFTEGLAQILDRHVTTTIRKAGTNETSDIGSAILRNLEPGANILLITDGNVNEGAALDDVAFYATTLNATISAINLSAKERDAAVVLNGPSRVVAESDTTFAVIVSSTDTDATVHLTIDIDGVRSLEKDLAPGAFTFTRQFGKGDHRIEARIVGDDAEPLNNVFYKEVHVLPKPKILYLTQKSGPEELLLRQLYELDKRSTVPSDLSPYYAIVANDVPVESFGNAKTLHDFLIDERGEYYGNGIVVLGGLNSFDKGGYAGSSLEPLLPVRVGKGERKKGNANLIFVVDASGGTTRTKYRVEGRQFVAYDEAVPTLDVIKAQVVNAVEQIKIDNKVGVIVFGIQLDTESASSAEERMAKSVVTIAKLDFLYNNRQEIIDNVPRLVGGGPSNLDIAIRGAIQQLQAAQGDKNILLLTDGRYCAGFGSECTEAKQLLAIANNAHKLYGINFMAIGVGTTDNTLFPKKVDELFLKEFAKAGDGTYDRATQLNTLLIKWGDPKAKQYGQEFVLVPLSLTHFITRDVEPTAVLNGFNQVVPKDTAELLVTSDSGQPALTVWRYGNGRVATWTVFAGGNLGQLLTGQNSLLLSRTVNWAIGDPQRKEPYIVEIADGRINEVSTVVVRSDDPVTSEALSFTKDGNRYTASFQPTELGWNALLNQEYAVNRQSELDLVGMNAELSRVTEATGGKVFKPSESDAIIEFIKEVSKKVVVERQSLAFPVLVAAMLLFLLELGIRRLTERR